MVSWSMFGVTVKHCPMTKSLLKSKTSSKCHVENARANAPRPSKHCLPVLSFIVLISSKIHQMNSGLGTGSIALHPNLSILIYSLRGTPPKSSIWNIHWHDWELADVAMALAKHWHFLWGRNDGPFLLKVWYLIKDSEQTPSVLVDISGDVVVACYFS